MASPISQPTFPVPMVEGDMLFNALMDVMVADDIFFGVGSYTESDVNAIYATQGTVKLELSIPRQGVWLNSTNHLAILAFDRRFDTFEG